MKEHNFLKRLVAGIVIVVMVAVSANATITVHSSCTFGTNVAGNTVDDNLNTYGTVSGTGGGWVIYDLGAAEQFDMLALTARNWSGYILPDGLTASTIDNDNVDNPDNWTVVGSSNTMNLNSVRTQWLGIDNSNKRYVKLEWSGTHGSYSGFSEFDIYKTVSGSNKMFANTKTSTGWPWRMGARACDGDLDTFGGFNEGVAGWVVVDLGSVKTFDSVRITSRDYTELYFPKASKVYVYSDDNPLTGTELEIGSSDLAACISGASDCLDVTESTKRYIKFAWTGTHNDAAAANIAEIDVIPEPATILLLSGGIVFLARYRHSH